MKQPIKFSTQLMVVFSLMVFACSEDLTTNDRGDQGIKGLALSSGETEGLVLYTGEVADELYKPLNLPESFEIDSLQVIVNYELTQDGYQCGLLPISQTTIKINEIKKNN